MMSYEPLFRTMQEKGITSYQLQKMGFNGSELTYGGPGSPRWHTPYSHLKAFLAHPFSIMRYFGGNITHVQALLDRPGVRHRIKRMPSWATVGAWTLSRFLRKH